MRSRLNAKLNAKLEHGLRKLQDRAPPVVAGAIDEIIDRAIPNARRAQEMDLPTLAPRSAPPTEVQTYGPELETADHTVRQAFFKYSQCNGKKRALLVSSCFCSGFCLVLEILFFTDWNHLRWVGCPVARVYQRRE
jgi:hypothetical protein